MSTDPFISCSGPFFCLVVRVAVVAVEKEDDPLRGGSCVLSTVVAVVADLGWLGGKDALASFVDAADSD